MNTNTLTTANVIASLPLGMWIAIFAAIFTLGLVAFIVVGGYVVRGYRILKGEANKQSVGPQPFIVQQAESYATKGELELVEGKVDAVDADVKLLRKEIVANGDKRRESIEAKLKDSHDSLSKKIDDTNLQLREDIKEDMGGMRRSLEDLQRGMGRLEGKISEAKNHD